MCSQRPIGRSPYQSVANESRNRPVHTGIMELRCESQDGTKYCTNAWNLRDTSAVVVKSYCILAMIANGKD